MPRAVERKCVRCVEQLDKVNDEHLGDAAWLKSARLIAESGKTTCQVCLESDRILAQPKTERRLRDDLRRLLFQRGYVAA